MRFNLADYETVQQRMARFHADHPNGAIHTELVSDPNRIENVVVVARVWFDIGDALPRGVDMAQETAGGTGANQNCWLENCSTSAIGRALANCGYSGDKRASREEMVKAGREPDVLSAPGPGGRFAQQRRSGPAPAPPNTDGEIKDCWKCHRPVRMALVDGKAERFNADGGQHFRTCGRGPTGYEDAAPAGAEADPFAEDADYGALTTA